jgi:hypothetical protein
VLGFAALRLNPTYVCKKGSGLPIRRLVLSAAKPNDLLGIIWRALKKNPAEMGGVRV